MHLEVDESISSLLQRSTNGAPDAAADLTEVLYRRMRTEAERQSRLFAEDALVDTQMIARDVLGVARGPVLADYRCRAFLLRCAAHALRRLLADRAREALSRDPPASTDRRSGGGRVVLKPKTARALIRFDSALEALERQHPRRADVMVCAFFGRMTFSEIAAALASKPATAKCDWTLARHWLHEHLYATPSRSTTSPSR